MKIQQHRRMKDVRIGDEVVCYGSQLYARVEEIFPAAVCVRLAVFRQSTRGLRLMTVAQLWRADEIENLSVCQYCGSRDTLTVRLSAGVPFRSCPTCATVQSMYTLDQAPGTFST